MWTRYLAYCCVALFFAQPTYTSAFETIVDLSEVNVSVKYSQSPTGDWEYNYAVVNGSTTVNLESLMIDLSCTQGTQITPGEPNMVQGEGFLDSKKYPEIETRRTGVHVPATISAAPGAAAFWGISAGNEAFWMIFAKPLVSRSGLVIASKGKPSLRNFSIAPYADLDMTRDEDSPEMDEEGSHALYGLIIGPSCEASTDVPPEEPADPVFEGTPPRAFGLDGVNDVLTYTHPTQSQLTVPASQTDIALSVHYASSMNPASFKVEPGWARELFHPTPGGSETVTLPLKMGLNRFRLEADMEEAVSAPGLTHDLDVFSIRRGKTPPGQAKKQ